MQCYQGQAVRLLLFADTAVIFPETFFDPFVLEDVLDEFDVGGVQEYRALMKRNEWPGRPGRRPCSPASTSPLPAVRSEMFRRLREP